MSSHVQTVALELARFVADRSERFATAAAYELGLRVEDTRRNARGAIGYLRGPFATDLVAMTYGRQPICSPGEHVAMMLPSNGTVYFVVDIARVALAGNRILVRLTSRAPTVAGLIQDVFDEVLPGLVTVEREMSGAAFLTAALESEAARLVMVWGGEQLGDELFRRVEGIRHKRIFYEGPGKDPAVVLAGADADYVGACLVAQKFAGSGQACVAPENIIAHRSVHDRLVEVLIDACNEARLGEPDDGNATIGPMVSSSVPEMVRIQLTDAVALGATIAAGGIVEGRFVHPSVVTGVGPKMKLFQDETFAPVFGVAGFDDEAEGMALARSTRFGLRASVFGPGAKRVADQLRGEKYARRVPAPVFGRFGMTSANGKGLSIYRRVFGGYGKSGWTWEDGELCQGPKSTAREATAA